MFQMMVKISRPEKGTVLRSGKNTIGAGMIYSDKVEVNGWIDGLACHKLAPSEQVPNGLWMAFTVKLFRNSVRSLFQPLFHTV
jgi:hypothetical protein